MASWRPGCRNVISRGAVFARVHRGRLGQARQVRLAKPTCTTAVPHRSWPGTQSTFLCPCGQVTALACQLVSGRTGPTNSILCSAAASISRSAST